MTVLTNTRYGVMECLPGDSIVSRALQIYGEWAQLELDVLAGIIQPGDCVLDVGAFLGTHTLAFAQMVGDSGKVHSFEPRQAISEILASNVQRNGLHQVVVHAYALGEKNSELSIKALDIEQEQNFGGLALAGVDPELNARTERILIRTLDGIDFEKIDFIKIDAEGMEAEVLLGGVSSFAKHRPVLFAECNDLIRGSKTMLSCHAMGYVVYGVLSTAFNPNNYRGVNENIFSRASEAAFLAIPVEKEGLLLARGFDLTGFAKISTLDEMSLLLLHKPQYVDEVLGKTEASHILGTDFSSPLALRQSMEIAELALMICQYQGLLGLGETGTDRSTHELALDALRRIDHAMMLVTQDRDAQRRELILVTKDRDAHKKVHETLASYQSTSLAFWWGKVIRMYRRISRIV